MCKYTPTHMYIHAEIYVRVCYIEKCVEEKHEMRKLHY